MGIFSWMTSKEKQIIQEIQELNLGAWQEALKEIPEFMQKTKALDKVAEEILWKKHELSFNKKWQIYKDQIIQKYKLSEPEFEKIYTKAYPKRHMEFHLVNGNIRKIIHE